MQNTSNFIVVDPANECVIPSVDIKSQILTELPLDDPAAGLKRSGTVNWLMDGQAGSRQIDTQGPFEKELWAYPGYSGPCSGPNQPYQSTYAFEHALSATQTEIWDRWAVLEPPFSNYVSKFRTRELLLKQGMYMAAGQACTGPILKTQGSFQLVASLRVPRLKDVRCMFSFQSRGPLWQGQIGRLGSLTLNILNSSNNQSVYSMDITPWLNDIDVNYKLILSNIIGDAIREDIDEFIAELIHFCEDEATTLGTSQTSGAILQFALANETSRDLD
ncbi:hypothetical protein [Pseudomonas sp. ZS1P83]